MTVMDMRYLRSRCMNETAKTAAIRPASRQASRQEKPSDREVSYSISTIAFYTLGPFLPSIVPLRFCTLTLSRQVMDRVRTVLCQVHVGGLPLVEISLGEFPQPAVSH